MSQGAWDLLQFVVLLELEVSESYTVQKTKSFSSFPLSN